MGSVSLLNIPQAPGTPDRSALALRMAVNIVDPATEAITLHTLQQFAGDFTIRFVAWINGNVEMIDLGVFRDNLFSGAARVLAVWVSHL